MAKTTKFRIKRKDSDKGVIDEVVVREELKIGSRQSGIDLILNHPAVSPVHAFIREKKDRLWIVDVLDENATFLNGDSITEAPLLHGDEIQIGPFSLRVHFEHDELLIIVERGLKAPSRLTADSEGRPDALARVSGLGEEEKKALRIFWQNRKREAGKIAITTPLYPVGFFGKGKARFNWVSSSDLKPIKRRVWLTRVLTIVGLASIGALFLWKEFYSPAPLASAHSASATLKQGIALGTVSSCSDCHHVFGNQEHDCTDCHQVARSPGDSAGGFDPKISDAHRAANVGCVGCHSEHNGADFPIKDVDNRSCLRCHNDQYEFRGRIIGFPHKGSAARSNTDSPAKPDVGYIRAADDLLTWDNQKGKEAVYRFHLEHPYTQKCNYCHQPGSFATEEWEKSPRASCQACHAVSFDQSEPKAIGPNCATCHKQHGQLKGLKLALSRISEEDLKKLTDQVRAKGLYSLGNTSEEIKLPGIGGANVLRQGRINWSWAFISKLGIVPWYFWTAAVGILGLGGTALVAFGNVRRKRLMRDESNGGRIRNSVQADQESGAGDNPRRLPPAYTFPRIDPGSCIGCHACIEACPHDVLTMSREEIAVPIAPAQCMDDTRCQTVCPTQACIVANSQKPVLERIRPERNRDTYMTGVSGLYIIGDVAKIPLIKHAISEGASVISHIERELEGKASSPEARYDVAVIGAGPAGLSAALMAKEKGLRYVAIEQHKALATIRGYPARKKINLTADGSETQSPLPLPEGQNNRRKEEILDFWTAAIANNKLSINDNETCAKIEPGDGFFTVTTVKGEGSETGTYTARTVVLAMGSTGTPSLTVKGVDSKIPIQRPATKCQNCGAPRKPDQEACFSCAVNFDQSSTEIHLDDRVKYKLTDARSYDGKKCVVVGGGNSAIEAAVQLTGFRRTGDNITFARTDHVTLLVRSDFTPDLKFVNKMNLYDCLDAGRIDLRFRTEIIEIRKGEVILMKDKKEEKDPLPNDYVFYCIGKQWPQGFLKALGITILNAE